MPWDMKDYPASLKNFDTPLKKKIIDIANALLEEGYDDDRAIPIAITEGKKWYKDASKSEIETFNNKKISKSDKHDVDKSQTRLLDKDVTVKFDKEREKWEVKTEDAKKVSNSYDHKKDALERAKEIADNKGVKVVSYTKEGKKE